MKRCMSSTRLGETAYTLKDIEFNEGIKVSKLRRDIKNRILYTSGMQNGAYYIIQSQLNRYLRIVNRTLNLSHEQIHDMRHALGLDYENKPYRNRFYCNSDDKKWNDIVSKKLAFKDSNVDGDGHCSFWLSYEGIAYILGKSISIEKYKEL